MKRPTPTMRMTAGGFRRGLLRTVSHLAMTAPLICARMYPNSFDELQATTDVRIGNWGL